MTKQNQVFHYFITTFFIVIPILLLFLYGPLRLSAITVDNPTDVSPTVTPAVKVLDSISATNPTNQVNQDSYLDTTGVVVTAHYSDGSSEVVTNWTHNFVKTDVIGETDVTITYLDKTYTIKAIVRKKIATNIGANYNRTTIYNNGGLVKSNVKVTAYYDNNTQRVLGDSEWNSNFTPQSKLGNYTFTITYQKVSTNLTVNIISKPISKLIATNPTRAIVEGTTLDKSDISVVAIYTDGTSDVITDYTTSYNTYYGIGAREVKIYYNSCSTSIIVNIISKSVSSLSAYYTGGNILEGGSLVPEKLTLYVYYNNGSFDTINGKNLDCYRTFTQSGYQTISISYQNKSTTFSVYVTPKTLTRIEAKYIGKDLLVGEALNKDNITVYAYYDNGTVAAIATKDFTTDFTSSSVDGTFNVKVSYSYFTSSISVKVYKLNPIINFDTIEKTIYSGKSFVINSATVDIDKSKLFWSSSDNSIAIVTSNGKVIGKSGGTVVVSLSDGTTVKNCTVTVLQSIEKISFSLDSKTIKKGHSYTLKYTISPTNTHNDDVIFKTSNGSIVKVNQSGKIKGLKKGTCYVYVTSKQNKSVYDRIKITVK